MAPVERLPELFEQRKDNEKELLSSHGEASRFFVTFLDNHDQSERIRHPLTPTEQVTQAIGLLYTLQGIPCLYYGTEQDLSGTVNAQGEPDLAQFEGVREALWGKPGAFATNGSTFSWVRALSDRRRDLPALRYGRQYFRPISGNGTDFGHPRGEGEPIAYARILGDQEVLILANTSASTPFHGHVLIDRVVNHRVPNYQLSLSNLSRPLPAVPVRPIDPATFWDGDVRAGVAPAASVEVDLAPMEFQILIQAG
jgi:glycosidase